jgi:hypothetical protein
MVIDPITLAVIAFLAAWVGILHLRISALESKAGRK